MKPLVALAVGVLAVAGCSAGKPDPADSPTPAPDPLADPKYGERIVSERGTLMKEIGQLAAMGDVGENLQTVVMAEFKVTGIDPNFQCPAARAQPPANGNYIAINVEVTATPELAEVQRMTGMSSFSFTDGFDFTVLAPDGTMEDPYDHYGATGNAATCLDEENRLPAEMEPGETAEGTIVLDSPYDSGTLLLLQPSHYTPGEVDCCWEWVF